MLVSTGILRLIGASIITISAGAATADDLEWKFSYSGNGVSASGTITTSSALNYSQLYKLSQNNQVSRVPGAYGYDVLSVTGSVTGSGVTAPITGLFGSAGAPADTPDSVQTYDNLLFVNQNTPALDFWGLEYSANNTTYNVFSNGAAYTYPVGYDQAIDVGGTEAVTSLANFSLSQIVAQQGGSLSAPVTLTGAQIGEIDASIGGAVGSDYYSFNWGGGEFSASAQVGGGAGSAYDLQLFSSGAYPLTESQFVGDQTGSVDLFLAPGTYTIGVSTTSPVDPQLSIDFNTPLNSDPDINIAVPEPTSILLLGSGAAGFGLLRRSRRRAETKVRPAGL